MLFGVMIIVFAVIGAVAVVAKPGVAKPGSSKTGSSATSSPRTGWVGRRFKRRSGRSGYRFKAVPVLTENEQRLFRMLIEEFPGFYFFPQVGMAAIMAPDYPDNDSRRLSAFRSISQKRLDFLVCDKSLETICLLELDDASHDPNKDRDRDEKTAAAGHKTVRLKTARHIDLSPLRGALAGRSGAPRPLPSRARALKLPPLASGGR